MKVYAVVQKISGEYDEEYEVVTSCLYLKEEDAKKKLDELVKEHRWSEFKMRDFEVKE